MADLEAVAIVAIVTVWQRQVIRKWRVSRYRNFADAAQAKGSDIRRE
jgi:hypothetical protein